MLVIDRSLMLIELQDVSRTAAPPIIINREASDGGFL